MTYYIKGGSRFNEVNPTVWVGLNLAGFPDSKYLDSDWKEIGFESIIDNQDPFWLLGSATGGAKELELGLYNDYRIKFETTGITYWDGDSWEDLLGGGAHTHDGETLQLDGVNSDGGTFDFKTSGVLNLLPSGITVDGLQIYTSGGKPRVKVIGGADMYLESDDANQVRILLSDIHGYGLLSFYKSAHFFKVYSTHSIHLEPNADYSNYIELSTTADVPKIDFVGGNNGLITNVADPTDPQDVATRAYVLAQDHHTKYLNSEAVAAVEAAGLSMGALIAMGGYDITFTGGSFEYGQSTPAGVSVMGWNGYFYATKVYKAVYN